MTQSFYETEIITFILLCLAVFRIYLEVVGFDFSRLPLTKMLNRPVKFHKYGFYFSLGYFFLFAPGYFF